MNKIFKKGMDFSEELFELDEPENVKNEEGRDFEFSFQPNFGVPSSFDNLNWKGEDKTNNFDWSFE